MNTIPPVVSAFEPISLPEMDSIALMNRTDTKFIFRYDRLENILTHVASYYKVLEINGTRASKYETLYYDTRDFKMYLDHHRRKPGRFKVRHRIYVDSGLHFFEIKFKNNKGRTVKSRVRKTTAGFFIDGKAEELLNEKTSFSAGDLTPKLWSNCSRITLAGMQSKERLTIDLGLQFRNEMHEKNFPDLVIAEVKQEKLSPSPFISLMKREKIRSGSFSKYCFGVVYLYSHVKKNNFKPKLIYLNKITGHGNKN